MRLTLQTDYSLRVLLYLGCAPDEQLATIQHIAQAYHISENHLMKVVHKLSKLGYIETFRGNRGGMRLARPAQEIVLGTLVRQVEEDFALVECLSCEDHCVITPVCQLRSVLIEAFQAFLHVLDTYTLADLLEKKDSYMVKLYPRLKQE